MPRIPMPQHRVRQQRIYIKLSRVIQQRIYIKLSFHLQDCAFGSVRPVCTVHLAANGSKQAKDCNVQLFCRPTKMRACAFSCSECHSYCILQVRNYSIGLQDAAMRRQNGTPLALPNRARSDWDLLALAADTITCCRNSNASFASIVPAPACVDALSLQDTAATAVSAPTAADQLGIASTGGSCG